MELQEQQIRKKDSQSDNHDTGIGKSVVSILIAAVIIAVVGFVIHDYTKTKEVNEHASDNIYDALSLAAHRTTSFYRPYRCNHDNQAWDIKFINH